MRRVCGGALALGLLLSLAGPAAAGGADDTKPLLDKALKALGGEEKAARLRAGSFKGRLSLMENNQEIALVLDASWQGRGQYRFDAEVQVNNQSNKVLLVANGAKAWIHSNGATKDFPEKDLPFLKDLLYAVRLPQQLAALRDKEFKLAHLGEVNVKDKQAVGLTVAHKDFKEVSLFFDKKDGLPVKTEVRLTTPNGKEITVESFYSDYKEFDGVQHPTRVLFQADGKEFTLELTEVRAQDKLDDSVFAQP